MTAHCDFIAGVFAGACNMFISHPLDTVKTNMQSGNMRFIQATKILFKTEGAKSYYRGLLFPLCSTGFMNSIIFGVYGNSFRIYQNMTSSEESKQKYWFTHVFLGGCTAGLIKAICACPIELSKVRLQVKVNNETGPLMVFRLIRQTEGLPGVFRGLESMLWRDIIPYGLFMFVYEYMIEKMRSPSLQRPYHYKEETVEPLRTAVAGACAGMLSWIPGIPFDVIKTRMMTTTNPNQYRNVLHCFSEITKEHGYKYLFRGGTVLVLRSAPVSAVSFIAYEHMLRHCQSHYQFS
ncbi:solute carrier family 25 member 45-like [Contarinia nasturtii]|uniref:solute carrier family 25 member 45-like n=1 Tax=Contarinia nasturtii TaxID=265458 RepID=UPI0012D42E99|nr:solute carrier family 25 member 45-like [Contarinia nasturtii]XP_031633052.1 solute carrier family 25 member 45-like [Contarinia nasturtii]XP_031633053.1 solute carrier family 25 member 45-like [Contarinia nasturtii]XP_031633054.1 solute carrier family 25 member 45-like [Contarinia nasturtii]XP_031633055.1 solute carrier family 25 member 45-like [Contarinia nasturtii]XP_031633056.1 solute carrier family 25 member 45-like [Contarinia nasturtii]